MLSTALCRPYNFTSHSRHFASSRSMWHPTSESIKYLSLGVLLTLSIAYLAYKNSNKKMVAACDQEGFPLHFEKIKALQNKWDHSPFSDQPANDLICRAKEIRAIYKDTHYTFIHAQASNLTPLVYLMTLISQKNSSSKHHFFKYIRMPSPDLTDQKISEKVEKVLSEAHLGRDFAPEIGDYLLSVDAFFDSTSSLESAQDLLAKNHSESLWTDIQTFSVFSQILSNYTSIDPSSHKAISKKIWATNTSVEAKCGNLWVICIPKSLLQESFTGQLVYPAHPYGFKCECHQGILRRLLRMPSYQNDIELLEQLQEDKYVPRFLGCFVPQYRIVTPLLQPNKSVYSFMLTTLSKEDRKSMKKHISYLISE